MSFRDKNPPRASTSLAAAVRPPTSESAPSQQPTAPRSLTETAVRDDIGRRLHWVTGTVRGKCRWYLVLVHPGKLEIFLGALDAAKGSTFYPWDYARMLESGDGEIFPDGLAAKTLDRLVSEKLAEIARQIESASDSPTTH
ncbi:hypothetical protein [Tuwongella immobilis]|uniref:Uncharacterized protein n=1 Tax=Tuwongella immobilis TaxID=692036 RepID=A0A6C2YKW1_9BACT|nr:hypothetical protein [Tuwongella immobilis]VIP02218.1 unnamed protein product [Tuwongella immobilis]VTS00741.1 unnamed protein product [Tuwongella immobilis]